MSVSREWFWFARIFEMLTRSTSATRLAKVVSRVSHECSETWLMSHVVCLQSWMELEFGSTHDSGTRDFFGPLIEHRNREFALSSCVES